ncbi:MAG: ABC transporter substrate-binding protein [Phycisphaerales bacterium]
MNAGRMIIFVLFAAILGVPFAMRPAAERSTAGADVPTLIVVTPHVPQIRQEFSEAFDRWHVRKHATHVRIDWRQPGGTSEIMKQLEAQYYAAASAGRVSFADPKNPVVEPGTVSTDIMFGGGTYEHGRLKKGIKVKVGGEERGLPLSQPLGFDQPSLDAWYGENKVGSGKLYDPDQYWLGTALSGFGIVYNKDAFRRIFPGIEDPYPKNFDDLANPALIGEVTLADPRQSGSVTTAFEGILNFYGWERGWKLLREMCANTRSFTNSSPKTPLDVAQGEAAAGLAIDFYGRGQSQAIVLIGEAAESSRVGYIDPKGATYIDADPVSVLRGAPHPELSKRFVEFALTDEAQALWQFYKVSNPLGAKNPAGETGEPMGPRHAELRRMPIRRVMYERYAEALIDKVNPFDVATDVKSAGWRSAIPVMMGAFAVDSAHEQREAWAALNRARRAGGFSPAALAEMEGLFYAWPTTEVEGKQTPFTTETYTAVKDSWKALGAQQRAEAAYLDFFRRNYARIVEIERSNRPK